MSILQNRGVRAISYSNVYRESLKILFRFDCLVSDPITALKAAAYGPSESETEFSAYVLLTWNSPCKSNGEIEHFEVNFTGYRQNHESTNFTIYLSPAFNPEGSYTYNETDLLPEYDYKVSVRVKTRSVEELSLASEEKFSAPAGSMYQIVNILFKKKFSSIF